MGRNKDRDLHEELRSHLDMAARDRIERGESAQAAADAARREFGSVALVHEVTRETWGGRWLERCVLRYWGDIDTHGYAILDQLRSRFPHTQSLLMDRATLMAHQAAWGRESAPVRHDLPRLSADERALYDELRDNRIQPDLRLEQERIGYGWLEQALR